MKSIRYYHQQDHYGVLSSAAGRRLFWPEITGILFRALVQIVVSFSLIFTFAYLALWFTR